MKWQAPRKTQRNLRGPGVRGEAFSLVEVVIALSIVSFALIAILGLLPVGLSSLKDSVADTSNSLLILNVRETLVGKPCVAGALGPYYFDSAGGYHGESPVDGSYYRVDVTLAAPHQPRPGSSMLVASVVITWPTNLAGDPGAQQHKTSFLVTPLTGSGWEPLDASFIPKIGL